MHAPSAAAASSSPQVSPPVGAYALHVLGSHAGGTVQREHDAVCVPLRRCAVAVCGQTSSKSLDLSMRMLHGVASLHHKIPQEEKP